MIALAYRDLWNFWRSIPGSVRLRAGELDRLTPLLSFLGKALSILCRREGKHHAPKITNACLDPRISQDRIDLPVELVDDVGRRIPRRTDAGPCARLETGHEVSDCRDIRKRFQARRGRYCQWTQRAGADVFD